MLCTFDCLLCIWQSGPFMESLAHSHQLQNSGMTVLFCTWNCDSFARFSSQGRNKLCAFCTINYNPPSSLVWKPWYKAMDLLKLDSFHGCWGCCGSSSTGWHRKMVKTSCWLGSVSSVGWWAATVATYCSRRKAEHPKFESTEGFNHSTVSPCSGGEVGTGMGGGCRNYFSLFGSRLWILLDISHIIAASMAICGRPVSHLLVWYNIIPYAYSLCLLVT